MRVHYLKTLDPHFEDVAEDRKTFELRKNDRDYQEDDILVLRQYARFAEPETKRCKLCGMMIVRDYPYDSDDSCTRLEREHVWETEGTYSGYQTVVRVKHLLHGGQFGLAEGYVCMSIEKVDSDVSRHIPSEPA